ncbi:prolyl oligopeptidase family serine peptidase [Nocardia sp. NPDC006044]|uniref:prolyl oligopeptidase family serine peptidase n=1 Tax=Nocardia sp. NPDC006044 TaxID=3364306 RepID=UPI003699860B
MPNLFEFEMSETGDDEHREGEADVPPDASQAPAAEEQSENVDAATGQHPRSGPDRQLLLQEIQKEQQRLTQMDSAFFRSLPHASVPRSAFENEDGTLKRLEETLDAAPTAFRSLWNALYRETNRSLRRIESLESLLRRNELPRGNADSKNLGRLAESDVLDTADDDLLRLEQSDRPEVVQLVLAERKRTVAWLGPEVLERWQRMVRDATESLDDIVYPDQRDEWMYTYVRDRQHPHGRWLRATAESYRTGNPVWSVLLDLEQSAFSGYTWLNAEPDPTHTRALVALSRLGNDSHIIREYDLTSRRFVSPADGGFDAPEALSLVSWIDRDTIYIATDFGRGSLTESNMPRIVKRWHRGTELSEATTVFEGESTDIRVYAGYGRTMNRRWFRSPGSLRHYLIRQTSERDYDVWLLSEEGWRHLDVPSDSLVFWSESWLLILLRSSWTTGGVVHPAGALLAVPLSDFLGGGGEIQVVFTPDDQNVLIADWNTIFSPTPFQPPGWLSNYFVIPALRDAQNRLLVAAPDSNNVWNSYLLEDATPPNSRVRLVSLDPAHDRLLVAADSATSPPALMQVSLRSIGASAPEVAIELLTSTSEPAGVPLPITEQYFATAEDGARVPYFITRLPGATGSTIVYAYGSHGTVSAVPTYNPALARRWVADGNIWVSAGIRGGGECGGEWHLQGKLWQKLNSFEDFAAVVRDLHQRRVTTPAETGAIGTSFGGLVAAVMAVRYPELFGGIFCEQPLLDMIRFDRLQPQGRTWITEYGDPGDPIDRAFLTTYSPLEQIRYGTHYPALLFFTRTADDRVTPGQARRMQAKLRHAGHENTYYYESDDGAHGYDSTADSTSLRMALMLAFFDRVLRREA